MDEPTSGLDPISRDELLDIFLTLAREGVSILFSTHITSDLEKCADRITYIRNGTIRASEALESFTDQYRAFSLPESQLTPAVREKLIGIKPAKHGYSAIALRTDADALAMAGEPADLETIMIHLEKE